MSALLSAAIRRNNLEYFVRNVDVDSLLANEAQMLHQIASSRSPIGDIFALAAICAICYSPAKVPSNLMTTICLRIRTH
jgi:hypothetical protein